jgi:UDP-N-acetylmuramoyl-L-alanyl-D-glutamate--2,6-diaminopimelate ligase
MLLSDLLRDGIDTEMPTWAHYVDIKSIAVDSRQAGPKSLFVAIPGTKSDGAQYLMDAQGRGSIVAIAAKGMRVPWSVHIPVLRVADPRQALSTLASRFYATQPETVVAVTGTSGKTSVSEFTRQIFGELGLNSASLGTIGVVTGTRAEYGSLTTPDPLSLHATLQRLAGEGITHLAMEASSHGLDQRRLDGVRLKAAAFTNLGRDHLDYHPTVEEYLAAKLRLFKELLPAGAPVVVNTDGDRAADVIEAAKARGANLITVGRHGDTLRLISAKQDGFKQALRIEHAGKTHSVELPLVGAYQVENALTAAGLAIATGADTERVIAALSHIKGVKGRLEIVGEARGGLGVVDYAHKPEALIAALDACRPFATGRLICVVGCGGDRDKGKRPIMGEIAVQRADVVIVTDDNPRTETPETIRAEILAGAKGAREIGDRAEAIRTAVKMIGPGDVVLVAGKGHETGQIVGATTLPFSDQDVLADALERVGTV